MRVPGPLKRRALAVGGALVVGGLLAEGIARLLAPSGGEDLLFGAPDAMPQGLYRESRTLGSEPVPGFRGEAASMGYRVPVRINGFGLRGGEPGAGPRWLAVGDSFTIAVQVAEEQTFEARLGPALGVEVLNAGVDGYSTVQATRRYLALDDAVRAEAVILTYFLGNDFVDNERIPHLLDAGPPPPGAVGHPRVVAASTPITRFLLRHSMAYAYARVAMKRAALNRADDFDTRRFRDELSIFGAGGAERLATLSPPTRRALVDLRDSARARGDRLLVAVAPPSFALDPARARKTLATFGLDEHGAASDRSRKPSSHDGREGEPSATPPPSLDAPRRAALAILGELGIATCDLTPPLAESLARGDRPYFRFDGHWTSEGHRVVAVALRACLARP